MIINVFTIRYVERIGMKEAVGAVDKFFFRDGVFLLKKRFTTELEIPSLLCHASYFRGI